MTENKEKVAAAQKISTHTPHTRHDIAALYGCGTLVISTHTPHTRHDPHAKKQCNLLYYFYSHASYEA